MSLIRLPLTEKQKSERGEILKSWIATGIKTKNRLVSVGFKVSDTERKVVCCSGFSSRNYSTTFSFHRCGRVAHGDLGGQYPAGSNHQALI